MAYSKAPSLEWNRIFLSAVLTTLLVWGILYAIALLVSQNPDIINCSPGFDCLFAFGIWALVIYIPLTILISAIMIWFLVKQKRLVHIILSGLISLPLAYGLLWLIDRIR